MYTSIKDSQDELQGQKAIGYLINKKAPAITVGAFFYLLFIRHSDSVNRVPSFSIRLPNANQAT